MVNNNQYYVTENDVSQLMKMSNLPENFQKLFTRDYVAIKRDVTDGNTNTEQIQIDINNLEISVESIETNVSLINDRLDIAEINISNLDSRLDLVEVDLAQVEIDLNSHTADLSAHGATGNIVGADDYCTVAIGGTVLLCTSLADQAASTVLVTNSANAAPVIYAQSDAATWVTLLNELKADLNQLVLDHNAAVTKINNMLASERTAKQRAV